MSQQLSAPRILLISQWPNIKNGEYELIEKIKQTGYKIRVVDYFGLDVDSGECLNRANLRQEFDFAISFHYDTPNFINIPTYLWVANPLEFIHLRGDYRTVLLHHLRAYDDYLFNGSDTLKAHLRNVVGNEEWRDTALEMFPSCAVQAMIPPKTPDKLVPGTSRRVFYCGINWERSIDRAGRAQGLLDILQEKHAADFYGPNTIEGISPWEGFKSYKGEIPFDGVSMARVMQEYGAVLAVSSPAHMKSKTSSSRVFEGIAAGVPVISDENAHVKKLFGDLVYYFRGDTDEQRVQSILENLQQIDQNPEDARQRVLRAQALMAQRYCFEPCFERVLTHVKLSAACGDRLSGRRVDVFLFHHDPDPDAPGSTTSFHNVHQVIEAAGHAVKVHGVQVYLTCCGEQPSDAVQQQLPSGVIWQQCQARELTDQTWARLRLGEKVALLAQRAEGDFASFLTQFDFPMYDGFSKALDWFEAKFSERTNGVHVSGFFVNDLTQKAPVGTVGILRNNVSRSLYRWTQNSLAEHQMATLFFGRGAFELLVPDQIDRFDVVLPVSIIAAATRCDLPIHRSRHMLIRVQCGHFHRHYEAYRRATEQGFWAQHYDLVTNYNHELNALYDIHHESAVACEIAHQVSGHALPSLPPVDPAVYVVNNFIERMRPIYRVLNKLRRALMFWSH